MLACDAVLSLTNRKEELRRRRGGDHLDDLVFHIVTHLVLFSFCFQTLSQDVVHHRGRHTREPETETAERAAEPGKTPW